MFTADWTPSPQDERSVDVALAQLARQKYARATKGAVPPPASDLKVDVASRLHPGPTPGNTPVIVRLPPPPLDEADGGSPIIPRRPNATGAMVAPRVRPQEVSSRMHHTINVPLAADYVAEDEGGLVARAAEIVNTARDLLGTLIGARGARAWRE